VNLVKGLPIGVMVTGRGGIGAESIATLLKDLRKRLDPNSRPRHAWALDPDKYTISMVADRVRDFLFTEKAMPDGLVTEMQLRICGYSATRPLPEIWEVVMLRQKCDPPMLVRSEDQFGVNWDGDYEPLNRLILGLGTGFKDAAVKVSGMSAAQVDPLQSLLIEQLYTHMALPAMPVQDAIDLARYLVETIIGFVRFSLTKQPKGVGGAVEIAAITKHELDRLHVLLVDIPLYDGTILLDCDARHVAKQRQTDS
jgi:hypothetical protein